MLRNASETIPASGGYARFMPRKNKVQLSVDLATALGWNGPREIDDTAFWDPDDCGEITETVRAISAGEMTGAVSRSRVLDSTGQSRMLDWSFFRNTDPNFVCGVGMLVTYGEGVDTSRLLTEVVEGMHDGFAIYDPDDRLILSNLAYRSVLKGFGAAKLHGLQFSQIAELCRSQGVYDEIGTDTEKYVAARIAAHKSGHSVMFQTLQSGRVERIEERRLPSGHIVALHADVTDLHRESVAFKRKAHATLDFISVISHELRTPLVGLIGMLDELTEATSATERDRIMGIMRRSGDQLMNIANSALDLAKIEEGQMELEEEAFDPVESLAPVVERYSRICRNKGVSFVSDLKSNIGLRTGDPVKLIQVVENLLSNAVKFTSQGQVSLSFSLEPADVVRIEVKDTGIGIPPAFISRMMLPFTQADPSLTRKYGGTGLGMSVVSNLVRLMGGTVICTSVPDNGATFTVHVPLRPATMPTLPEIGSNKSPDISFAGKRVLIADDNEINRTVMDSYFRRLQFTTVLATDGEDALRKALTDDFDLVVLDISMPKIDGISVLTQLRQRDKFQTTPILAVTANVLSHELTSYMEAGFDACITKPFKRQDIAKIAAKFLRPDE